MPQSSRIVSVARAFSSSRISAVAQASTLRSWAYRLGYFWIVWSALLLIHEGGHALSASRQGLPIRSVTIGLGPVLGTTQYDGTAIVLRLVPIAGSTDIAQPDGAALHHTDAATLLGGIGATMLFAALMAALVHVRERSTSRRWLVGRFIVADAVVLTAFNLLPVPPLDGGRALLGALASFNGEPLTGQSLFWLQAGGFALAIVPMTIWTRWTARIDAAAVRWGTRRLR